ncbi:MAG TPA: hypothetical protein PK535_11670, partial [Synergistaceae bacterium]|nr:hypothetical protein [Synergistaceae bacterium]
ASGLAYLQDPETGEVIPGLGFSPAFREAYEDFQQLRRRQWLLECGRRGVSTLEISTTQDPGERLVQFFKRRRGA